MSRSSHPQTLRKPVTVTGHGLHSNQACRVILRPVTSPSGIRFCHTPSGTVVPATVEHVGDLSLSTTLVVNGLRFGTIEHLLSALAGLEVEHVQIDVDGPELPILDGSATGWADAIREAGIAPLPGARRFVKMLKPLAVDGAGKWMRILPHPGFRLRYTIDFDHPAIGRQARELTLTPERYRQEIASARTFCLERDIQFMKSRGLALGGSLDNAVVFGADGPLNDSLRFEDEAVRHKMLDLIGDLALLGAPLQGLVEAHAAGHALHVQLVKAILARPDAWEWAELPTQRPVAAFAPRLSTQAVPA